MTNVAEGNTLILVIALLVGLAVAWWIFKSVRRKDSDQVSSATPRRVEEDRPVPTSGTVRDTPEGNGIIDQGAAAATDVAGEVLGVQAHRELPGASGPPDNLETMKGVGPKFAAQLREHGINRFEQIASLNENEVAMLDERMGPFRGRLARDRVVEQASYLARGDTEGFEARFGKLGG